MKCDKCGVREATHHNFKNINGVSSESHLCYECAKSEDMFADFKQVKIGEFFDEKPSVVLKEKKCPVCLTGIKDIARTGLVGCSECYNVFSTELEKAIYQTQRSLKHYGKKAGTNE